MVWLMVWWYQYHQHCDSTWASTTYRIRYNILLHCYRLFSVGSLTFASLFAHESDWRAAKDTQHRMSIMTEALDRAYASEYWDRNPETLKIFLAPEHLACRYVKKFTWHTIQTGSEAHLSSWVPECLSTSLQMGGKNSGWGSTGVVRKVRIESGLLWNTRPKLPWKLCLANYDISVLSIGSWCFGWWNRRNKSQEGTCAKLPTNIDWYIISQWFVCIFHANCANWHCIPDCIIAVTSYSHSLPFVPSVYG